MPATRLMGGETEFAVAIDGPDGTPCEQGLLLRQIMAFARERLGLSSASSNGRFLPNGGLLYLDAGLHLEWATPECTSPHDVVRYLRAGDLIMSHLVEQFARDHSLGPAFCSRCNVDYVEGTCWASHESYLHTCDPSVLPDQLMPFLVSRVVFGGAGGFDAAAPGVSFTLSPRARFISRPVGPDAQFSRSIFHTKNEPLSQRLTSRLHVACSESLCSDLGTFLRFGTTALVVAIVEAGERPGNEVRILSPLATLWRVAEDPTCRALMHQREGRSLTAIEVQRHYLAAVERRLGDSVMPWWAGEVCARWRQVLDDLEADPARLSNVLDWPIKRAVFEQFLRSRGFDQARVTKWNRFLKRHGRSDDEGQDLSSALQRQRLDQGELEAFRAVRRQLFELDMRFGEIGPAGIFASLDAAGQLSHRVPGADDFEAAVELPPAGTRATLRGAVVRRLSERRTPYVANWTSVEDLARRCILDLGDPFESEERWRAMSAGRSTPPTDAAREQADDDTPF